LDPYFSDRPQRIVGHMKTTDFVDLWGEGENSFEEDPPNAVLAFLEHDDEAPEDAVVVIRHPRLSDGHLSYVVEVTRGRAPRQVGAGDLVHRPIRAAAITGLCVRGAAARAAADAAADLT
jgi:hypothetical protein